ncbi:MAG TPA: 50S ribosomal protein L25 [Phycisphaerales bacterium]|nr:50S ribosomal protein L25 [Phycisphaerales bacterium]
MKHDTPTINAKKRDQLGTKYARRFRKAGHLPAVMYGHKRDPLHIMVTEKDVIHAVRHGSHVVNVTIEDGQPEICLVKDLQYGYMGDNLIHVDFARVDLDEEVEVNVHLRFVGVPEASKKPGSVLSHPMTELPIICKVASIPDEIRIDISNLETMFTVGQIKLPEGVRTKVSPHIPVAQITFVHEEEVAAGEAAEVAEGTGTEPEVIGAAERAAKAAAAGEGKEGGKD